MDKLIIEGTLQKIGSVINNIFCGNKNDCNEINNNLITIKDDQENNKLNKLNSDFGDNNISSLPNFKNNYRRLISWVLTGKRSIFVTLGAFLLLVFTFVLMGIVKPKVVFFPSGDPDITPVDLIPKLSKIACTIQCTGIWVGGKGWGLTWKLIGGVVKPKVQEDVRGVCHIRLTDSDKREIENNGESVATPVATPVVAPVKEPISTIVEDSDDEEPAPTPTPTPSPEVKEPEPKPEPEVKEAPKKVVKKVIKKKEVAP
jgi:hypothetical protein